MYGVMYINIGDLSFSVHAHCVVKTITGDRFQFKTIVYTRQLPKSGFDLSPFLQNGFDSSTLLQNEFSPFSYTLVIKILSTQYLLHIRTVWKIQKLYSWFPSSLTQIGRLIFFKNPQFIQMTLTFIINFFWFNSLYIYFLLNAIATIEIMHIYSSCLYFI